MSTGSRCTLLIICLLALVGGTLLLWLLPGEPRIERHTLADGSRLTLAVPGAAPRQQVLVAVPEDKALADAQLLEISRQGQVRIGQFYLVAGGDCEVQQRRLAQALSTFATRPEWLAGIDAGASLAWRWLAGQDNEQARALSVGLNLEQEHCATPLPSQAAHGRWLVAWNDNPNDASARFVRRQSNAQTLISAYDTPLSDLLEAQLLSLLQGQGDAVPVVEVPAATKGDTLTLFYSGDGGWRDLDREVAEVLARRGSAVVGIDTLRYFWQHKTPEQSAADLSRLMQRYRDRWGARRFVLAGYSFGANVLPAIYNRLPAEDQQQVDALYLLALGRSASFQIEVRGWLGKGGQEAATGPELSRLPAAKVLCIYGTEERQDSGCTQPGAVGERLELPGGHHFDENYPALAERLLEDLRRRQAIN